MIIGISGVLFGLFVSSRVNRDKMAKIFHNFGTR